MAKGVFLHRPDSRYDDDPETRYQFPKQYLGRAAPCENDWIIYYAPRRGAVEPGYFAAAKVGRIVPDSSQADMYLALIEPGSYLPFERIVPFSGPDGWPERGVLNDGGRVSGRAQAAVRPLDIDDFNRILDLGLGQELPLLPRDDLSSQASGGLVQEERAPFFYDRERERIQFYASRIVRDRIFRRLVLQAYDCRCAITGLKFINGGGRAEVQAAHIKPVEHHGPDKISNGIALSGTVHWMFDRGLISLSDDCEVLVSRQVNDVESVWKLVDKSRRANFPTNPAHRPHPNYLAWHREHCFKH